ncbi:MAG: hypothetical protein M3252_06500 [Actinomycetota bacterium]|nr:hypothetical protein [Actinomycetota bacterium]
MAVSAAAALLLIASAAFACVQTRGKLTVTGGGGTSSATGNGNHTGPKNSEFCGPIVAGAQHTLGATPAQTVSVAVGQGTGDCANIANSPFNYPGPNQVPDGQYNVLFCNGRVFQNQGGTIVDQTGGQHGSCYSPSVTGEVAQIGTLAVSGGNGSGTYSIPRGVSQSGPNNYAGISIRENGVTPHPGPPVVNLAPIRII